MTYFILAVFKDMLNNLNRTDPTWTRRITGSGVICVKSINFASRPRNKEMLMMMAPLLRYFLFHSIYSLAASCSLQSAVCGLQSAVCSLQMLYTAWLRFILVTANLSAFIFITSFFSSANVNVLRLRRS